MADWVLPVLGPSWSWLRTASGDVGAAPDLLSQRLLLQPPGYHLSGSLGLGTSVRIN